MKEISKLSWHYKLWLYTFGPDYLRPQVKLPTSTDKCNYWLRVLLLPLPEFIVSNIAVIAIMTFAWFLLLLANIFCVLLGIGIGAYNDEMQFYLKYPFPDLHFKKYSTSVSSLLIFCYMGAIVLFEVIVAPMEFLNFLMYTTITVFSIYMLYKAWRLVKNSVKKISCEEVTFVDKP